MSQAQDPVLDSEFDEEEEDLVTRIEIVVDKGQEPLRIDRFLITRTERISRTRIQAAAKAGNLTVNGKLVKPNYRVRPLDLISIIIPKPFGYVKMAGENISLDIRYEDDDLLVLHKPAGMVVHPGVGNYTGTLVNALMHHFENLPHREDENRPGLVHRLDKNTSGLMVIAKNEYALSNLTRQFFDRTIERRYEALVWGDFEEESGTVNVNLGRHPRLKLLQTVFPDGEQGKHAITHYKVLEHFGYTTLVECKLETGRTHQIRVHMKYLNHPVFNDDRYEGDRIVTGTIYSKYKQFVDNCFKICPRHALHAKSLGFTHPVSGQWLQFESPLPEDMQQLVEKWRAYSKHLKLEDE